MMILGGDQTMTLTLGELETPPSNIICDVIKQNESELTNTDFKI